MFALVMHYYALWLAKKSRATFSTNQRFGRGATLLKTNRDLPIRVFPRLALATWICFEFWLVHWIVCICCVWSEWFKFDDTQMKTALKTQWLFHFTIFQFVSYKEWKWILAFSQKKKMPNPDSHKLKLNVFREYQTHLKRYSQSWLTF